MYEILNILFFMDTIATNYAKHVTVIEQLTK